MVHAIPHSLGSVPHQGWTFQPSSIHTLPSCPNSGSLSHGGRRIWGRRPCKPRRWAWGYFESRNSLGQASLEERRGAGPAGQLYGSLALCGALSAQDPDQGAPCLRPEGSAALLSALRSPFPPTCVSPQWIIAELACYTYSMVVVPLYDTLGPGAIRYIIDTGEPSRPLLPLAASPTSSSQPFSTYADCLTLVSIPVNTERDKLAQGCTA